MERLNNINELLTNMRINIDIDGVIGDNTGLFCKYIREEYGIDYWPEDVTEYNHEVDTIDMTISDIVSEIYSDRPEFIKEMELIDGAKETINSLNRDRHRIKLVTHRPNQVREETLEWINENGIYYNDIIVDAPDDKSEVVGDLMIDDHHEVVKGFIPTSKDAILFPRTYNLHVDMDDIHHPHEYIDTSREKIVRDESQWNGIIEIIENLS
jgi:uncharacterized HAD superfamily protein